MNRQVSLVIRYILSVVLVTAMVSAAVIFNEQEIIFPEIAALAVGAFIADKMPWKVNRTGMFILMTLSSWMGYAMSVYLTVPLFVKIVIAFAVCIIALSYARSTMLPMISAAVLPLLTNVQSMVYPFSVMLLTACVIVIRLILQKTGVLPKTELSDEKPDTKADLIRRIWLITIFTAVAAAAVCSGMIFIIAPPLAVFFAEAAERNSPVKKDPFRFFLCTILCAFAGTATRAVLIDLFRVNIIPAAAVAAAVSIFFLILFKKPFPPAAALAILPFILPETDIAVYPFQVTTGCAVFVSLDMLYQKAWDKGIPMRIYNAVASFIRSIQIIQPEKIQPDTVKQTDDTEHTSASPDSNDGELLIPSIPDGNDIPVSESIHEEAADDDSLSFAVPGLIENTQPSEEIIENENTDEIREASALNNEHQQNAAADTDTVRSDEKIPEDDTENTQKESAFSSSERAVMGMFDRVKAMFPQKKKASSDKPKERSGVSNNVRTRL